MLKNFIIYFLAAIAVFTSLNNAYMVHQQKGFIAAAEHWRTRHAVCAALMLGDNKTIKDVWSDKKL